jgi:Ser/Thr protein kinase RdoA (MazF antagonist)
VARLHAALRDYPGPLPYLGLVLDEIPLMTDLVERWRLVADDDLARLRRESARLRPLVLRDRAQARPLHGDAHSGNVLATESGLLWNDFEDTCAGAAAWDYAAMAQRLGLTGPEPEHYRAARDLQGVVWTLLLAHRFPERAPRAQQFLSDWRAGH